MQQLLQQITQSFFPSKKDYFELFGFDDPKRRWGRHMEGWCCGELLVIFDRMRRDNMIQRYRSEKCIPRVGDIDIELELGDKIYLMEVKTIWKRPIEQDDLVEWFDAKIARAGGDMTKLERANHNYGKLVLVFWWPRPTTNELDAIISSVTGWEFIADYDPKAHKYINQVPNWGFISLWKKI